MKRTLALPLIGTALISTLTLTSCAEDSESTNAASNDSNSSQSVESIPDNIVTDNRTEIDLSPYIMKAKTTKIANLPEGEATRGLQLLDGRIFGHAMTDKDTGASRVYSVDTNGGDYKIEKDFGSLLDRANEGKHFESEKMPKKVIQPEGSGLSVYQEPGSDDYVLDAEFYFTKTGHWSDIAKRTDNDKYDEDRMWEHAPGIDDNNINNCVDPQMMEKAGHYMGFTTVNSGKSNLMIDIGNRNYLPEIKLSSGSTTTGGKSTNLKGATDCGFAGNFLVTNIRNHFDTKEGTTPDGNANPKLKHRTHLAMSLPLTGDKYRKTEDGLPVDYKTSYLVDLEGIDPNKDVTALAIDPDNPDTAYVTVEGDNGLYKVDISSAHFGNHRDGNKFLDDMYARIDGKK